MGHQPAWTHIVAVTADLVAWLQQSEVGGVAHEVDRPQLLLMLQQQVVHGPKRALPVSGLGRLGAQRCVGVHVGQRQVSPDLSEVAEVGEKGAYHGLGLAAIGALEVAVLH